MIPTLSHVQSHSQSSSCYTGGEHPALNKIADNWAASDLQAAEKLVHDTLLTSKFLDEH